MVGRGVAQKNVGCLMEELYEDVLQNVLHLISQFNWLGAYYSAVIIMIFVSCSNIYGYLQNYQDCLTLTGLEGAVVVGTFISQFTEPICE
jgi:hypothetical protein